MDSDEENGMPDGYAPRAPRNRTNWQHRVSNSMSIANRRTDALLQCCQHFLDICMAYLIQFSSLSPLLNFGSDSIQAPPPDPI